MPQPPSSRWFSMTGMCELSHKQIRLGMLPPLASFCSAGTWYNHTGTTRLGAVFKAASRLAKRGGKPSTLRLFQNGRVQFMGPPDAEAGRRVVAHLARALSRWNRGARPDERHVTVASTSVRNVMCSVTVPAAKAQVLQHMKQLRYALLDCGVGGIQDDRWPQRFGVMGTRVSCTLHFTGKLVACGPSRDAVLSALSERVLPVLVQFFELDKSVRQYTRLMALWVAKCKGLPAGVMAGVLQQHEGCMDGIERSVVGDMLCGL